jgi:hypothetical protein
MRTIRQSKVVRTLNGHCRVGDIVIFDVLGAAPRGSVPQKQPLVKTCAVRQKLAKLHTMTLTAKRF